MQTAIDGAYEIEKKKLNRCQKLAKMVPSAMPADMKEQVDVLYKATCEIYKERLESLDALSAYLKSKTQENKSEMKMHDNAAAAQSGVAATMIKLLSEQYGNK